MKTLYPTGGMTRKTTLKSARKIAVWLWASLLMGLLNGPAHAASWALVIGVNDYENDNMVDLHYAVNDARDFSASLQKNLGYKEDHVRLMVSDVPKTSVFYPSADNVIVQMEIIRKGFQPGDTFMLFFSGHGFQDKTGKDNQFLATVNTNPFNQVTLEKSTLSLADLRRLLEAMPAQNVLFFVDACRNVPPTRDKGDGDNPLSGAFARSLFVVAGGANKGLAGSAVLLSCSEAQESFERSDFGHGVFTQFLLEGLAGRGAEITGEMTMNSLSFYVQRKVLSWSNLNLPDGKSQKPDLHQSGAAKIILRPAERIKDPDDEDRTPPTKTVLVSQLGQGKYTSLVEAVRTEPAGTRILVRPGYYQGMINLSKPMEIIGDGDPRNIVIESEQDCIYSTADFAVVRGLTLRSYAGRKGGKTCAVFITKGRILLENCDLSADSLAALEITGEGTNPTVRGCKLHDSAAGGLHIRDKAQATIDDCDIFGNALAGIEVKKGANATVRGCKIHDGKSGGVYVHDDGQGIFEDCDIFGNVLAGISVEIGGNPTMRDCKIHDGKSNGVLAYENGQGIFENCDIFGNTLRGIEIREGANPTMRQCRINRNANYGIWAHDKGQGTLISCDLTDNKVGAKFISLDSMVTLTNNKE